MFSDDPDPKTLFFILGMVDSRDHHPSNGAVNEATIGHLAG